MYLIEISTLTLQEYDGSDNLPPYAILSHRWEAEEASFRRLQEGKVRGLKGWSKIEQFCALAKSSGCAYAWADTCCIDKSSSAELSESINSMFKLYQEAAFCFAYLSDVHINHGLDARARKTDLSHQVTNSVWFKRGWTLQELLAPKNVFFFDHDWKHVGDKTSLQAALQRATGIKAHHLVNPFSASIAQKMSWASERATTRIEDMAYCLLGLFGVNMPLLYGEGKKAFRRLQIEIISQSDDETIFAWDTQVQHYRGRSRAFAWQDCDLLADSPAAFKQSANVGQHWCFPERGHYQMTNLGLLMNVVELPIRPVADMIDGQYDNEAEGHMVIPLNCAREDNEKPLCLILFISIGASREYRRSPWLLDALQPIDNTRLKSLQIGEAKTVYIS